MVLTAQLSATHLTLFRGERCLFQDLEFELSAGELLLLEGSNGSGKTSLMRVIAGLLSVESGTVLWDGTPIGEQRQEFHNAMVWLAHRTGLKSDLTLVDNLRFEQSLRAQLGVDFDEVCAQLGIANLQQLPLRILSAGQQRRVALARMVLADVPLWLLDEPFTNLDRDGRALVVQLVTSHLQRGGLCVMAAHQDISLDAPIKRIAL